MAAPIKPPATTRRRFSKPPPNRPPPPQPPPTGTTACSTAPGVAGRAATVAAARRVGVTGNVLDAAGHLRCGSGDIGRRLNSGTGLMTDRCAGIALTIAATALAANDGAAVQLDRGDCRRGRCARRPETTSSNIFLRHHEVNSTLQIAKLEPPVLGGLGAIDFAVAVPEANHASRGWASGADPLFGRPAHHQPSTPHHEWLAFPWADC